MKNPTLKKAIDMAKVIEQSDYCMRELDKRDLRKGGDLACVEEADSQGVTVISKFPKRSGRLSNTMGKRRYPRPGMYRGSGKMCGRCGSFTHCLDANIFCFGKKFQKVRFKGTLCKVL